VYLWADGIYANVRRDERRCMLVVVGCDIRGNKHFLAIEEGFRESTESWKALLLSLKDRGVNAAKLAVGDGALGFWAALAEVYPETREQRCWVHYADLQIMPTFCVDPASPMTTVAMKSA
jgi:transposase-like protein